MITSTSQAYIPNLIAPADKGGLEAVYSKDEQLKEHALLAFIMVI